MQEDLGYRDWSVANDEGFDTPYSRGRTACPNIPEGYRELEHHLPLRPYVRESRRLIGVRTLAARDIQRGGDRVRPAPIPSAVAIGDYPIDLHNCDTDDTLELGLETAAEKNLSQTRLVNGATRLQPATILTGQASGAIAAIAVERGLPPRRVKPFWVQDALATSGAVLAPHLFDDVPPAHPFFPYTQVVAARGLVDPVAATTFGVGDAGTRRLLARAIVKGFDLATDDPPATPRSPTYRSQTPISSTSRRSIAPASPSAARPRPSASARTRC